MRTASDQAPAAAEIVECGADRTEPHRHPELGVATPRDGSVGRNRRARYEAGASLDQIAEEDVVTINAVWASLKRAGAELRPPGRPSDPRVAERRAREAELRRRKRGRRRGLVEERRDHVERRYLEGASCFTIGKELGVSPSTVHNDLKERRVPRRRSGHPPRRVIGDRRPRKTCERKAIYTVQKKKRKLRLPACDRTFVAYPCEQERRHFCSDRCEALDLWNTGRISEELLVNPRMQQRWLGRWNATKPPATGGRPRGRPPTVVTAEQRASIECLAELGWGRRSIANRILVSPDTVRAVLAEIRSAA